MKELECCKCGSNQCVKGGILREKQRYKCKECSSYFIPATRKRSNAEKQIQTLALYLEGMPIRGIGRYLEISHVSVIRWIKALAAKLKPAIPIKADNIEIDELYLYIKSKKKKRWLWTAICRKSKQILGFQLGGRNISTLKKLYYKIAPIQCEYYYTDRHAPYGKMLPEKKQRTNFAGTNTIEGMHSAFRHYAARFRRRSKCYSKSEAMVNATLSLLSYKFNSLSDYYKIE